MSPDEPRPAWARRWGWGVGVTLIYVFATIIMTWPFAIKLAGYTPGGEDPLLQIWIARWVQHALITNPLHLYDANVFYPYEHTLAYSDSNVPAALLSAPIYLLTGNPILAVNLLVLGTFVLAAGGMYLLIGHLSGNRAAGFLAGLAYAFLPYRYAHIFHLNQLGHAWTPWVLFALVLLIERQTWRRALIFGLLFAVQAVTSFYVAFQLIFAVGLTFLVALIANPAVRTWRFFSRLAVAAALALVIILPLALPYMQVNAELGFERTIKEAENFEAGPIAYLRVQTPNRVWGWMTAQHGSEDTLFPGGFALVGAVIGLAGWRRRKAATVAAIVIGVVAFIIALGPTWRPQAGGTFPLPYRLLFDYFPFFKAMRVPARFGVLVDLAVVARAGFGVAWAWERTAPRLDPARVRAVAIGATAILALGILGELYSAPFQLNQVDRQPDVAAPYHWLASQPRGAVMEFPVDATHDPGQSHNTALAMFWSTYHWQPLVQGYSGFAPRAYGDELNYFTGDLVLPNGDVKHDVSYVNAKNIGVLQDLGVRYLLLHRWGYKREDWPTITADLEATGQVAKAGDFGEATIYLLKPPPPSGAGTAVNLDLFAPSIAAPGHFWEPAIVVHNPQDRLGLLTHKRPLTLTTTWRDDQGKVVRRDELPVNLPAIVPPGDLYCTIRLCPAASGTDAPPAAPGEQPLRFYPSKPGHYQVELALTGDITLSRTIDVNVTNQLPAPATGNGPPLAFASAAAERVEIAPGDLLKLTLDWDTAGALTENYTMFAQLIGPDGKVWGQYDAPAGWPSHYTQDWLPGEHVSLPWNVPLQAGAPPGQYRLLIGMYRHTASGVERIPLRYPGGVATEYWAGEFTVR
ncbi:MAG: hypothetical protein ACTHMU_24540 [Thermomicrobiales bacterium]